MFNRLRASQNKVALIKRRDMSLLSCGLQNMLLIQESAVLLQTCESCLYHRDSTYSELSTSAEVSISLKTLVCEPFSCFTEC